jgi:hypothetical protein
MVGQLRGRRVKRLLSKRRGQADGSKCLVALCDIDTGYRESEVAQTFVASGGFARATRANRRKARHRAQARTSRSTVPERCVMNMVNGAKDFVVRAAVASAVMTISQHLEIAATHRSESDLPVRVFERVTGISVAPGATRIVVGQLVQGMLAASALVIARLARPLAAVPATATTVAVLVSSNAVGAHALRLSDMPWSWTKQELGTDVLHKTSLAVAATVLARYTRATDWTHGAPR